MKWGVVVLAGGLVKDPLASALGTPRKALATIMGKTSLAMTLCAVRDAGFLDCVTVSGDDVKPFIEHGRLVIEEETQTQNARVGVEALTNVDAVLFLPADTPFLKAESLVSFTQEIDRKVGDGNTNWLATGLVSLSAFKHDFPRIAVHPIILADESYLSGALFAASPGAFMNAMDLIDEMSRSRKNQLSMLLKLGIGTVVRYLLHRVSLSDATTRLGQLFGAEIIFVTGCYPTSAADIDDVADLDELRIHASLTIGDHQK